MEDSEKMQDEVIKQVEKSIKEITDSGLTPSNLDNLGKLVDIHKDIEHEKYMKIKEDDIMRYYGRGNYGEGYETYGRRSRDSRGRYTEGGSYGRRGVAGSGRGRYRGEEMIDEMYGAFQDYHDGREEYNRSGNYGAKEDSTKGLEDMMMSITECVTMIFQEAEPEEKEIIRKHIRKMGEL